jgi:hypothetical protein
MRINKNNGSIAAVKDQFWIFGVFPDRIICVWILGYSFGFFLPSIPTAVSAVGTYVPNERVNEHLLASVNNVRARLCLTDTGAMA